MVEITLLQFQAYPLTELTATASYLFTANLHVRNVTILRPLYCDKPKLCRRDMEEEIPCEERPKSTEVPDI